MTEIVFTPGRNPVELFPEQLVSALVNLSVRIHKLCFMLLTSEKKNIATVLMMEDQGAEDPLNVIDFTKLDDLCLEYIKAYEIGSERDKVLAEEGLELVKESLRACGVE